MDPPWSPVARSRNGTDAWYRGCPAFRRRKESSRGAANHKQQSVSSTSRGRGRALPDEGSAASGENHWGGLFSGGVVMTFRDAGWVWEGQGLDPGVPPSIFGVGEGAPYFGLARAWYMFHPNDDLAMQKLRHLDAVICDIAKWRYRDVETGGVAQWVDSAPETVRAEAERVSVLSTRYPNLVGAVHDDMLGLMKRENYRPEQYAPIYSALKSANPHLSLWAVVYTHELDPNVWRGYLPYIDVVSLWVWEAKNLPHLEEYLQRCREVLPGKPIHVGCYLRDYPTVAPVPMELLKGQWECVLRAFRRGLITGYSILGAVLIDGHQEQANWIRDFIAAHADETPEEET